MMKKFIEACPCFFVLFFHTLCANAQYTDTLKTPGFKPDFSSKAVDRNGSATKNSFPLYACVPPAALIVYGFLSFHTDALQDVNETVKEEIYSERLPHHATLDNYLQYAPAAAVYGLNIAGIAGKNDFRDRTVIYAMSNLFLGVTVLAVKKITAEPRPDGSNNLSFPSGHASTAFAAAEFLRQEYKDVSPLYGMAGYAAAVATAYLRISNNKHWLGDVVAGAGVGIISTKLAYWMYPVIRQKLFKNKEVHTIVMPAYQNGVPGLGLVHYF